MDTGVLVALIAAATSLAVALVSAVVSRNATRISKQTEEGLAVQRARQDVALRHLDAEIDRTERLELQDQSAQAVLDRYRQPLLLATLDLASRIDNIRRESFLVYLRLPDERRRGIAMTSTMYRFARYWWAAEALYDSEALLKLESDTATRPVIDAMNAVGKAFATDKLDNGRLMMWREEQRALAELVRVSDTDPRCVGYVGFLDRYESHREVWFATLEEGLSADDAPSSERLRLLQFNLSSLAERLDLHGTHHDLWTKHRERSMDPLHVTKPSD